MDDPVMCFECGSLLVDDVCITCEYAEEIEEIDILESECV